MPISYAYDMHAHIICVCIHTCHRTCMHTRYRTCTHMSPNLLTPTSYTHAYTYHMHMHTHVTGHAHKGSYNMHMHLGGDFEMLVRARRVKFVSLRFQEMAAHAHAYTHAIGYAYTCHETCIHVLLVPHMRAHVMRDTRS